MLRNEARVFSQSVPLHNVALCDQSSDNAFQQPLHLFTSTDYKRLSRALAYVFPTASQTKENIVA